MSFLSDGCRLELCFSKKRSIDAHSLQYSIAFVKSEESWIFAQERQIPICSSDPDYTGIRESLGITFGYGLSGWQIRTYFWVHQEVIKGGDQFWKTSLFNQSAHCCISAVTIQQCQISISIIIAVECAYSSFVLPIRSFCHYFTIWMHIIHGHIEVFAHMIQDVWFVQSFRDQDEDPIDQRGITSSAFLCVLPIRIRIDMLC